MRTPWLCASGVKAERNYGSLGEPRGPEHLCRQGNARLTEPLSPQPGYSGCVLGARFGPKVHAVHTYSTQGECVWNVSITSKIMFNMFQTYCIKQIPKQYLKHILFFILIDCKCIKHMLRIYFIYCICKILSNLYRRKPQSHHRIGLRAIPFCKLTF